MFFNQAGQHVHGFYIQSREGFVENPQGGLAYRQPGEQYTTLLAGGEEAHREIFTTAQAKAGQRLERSGFVERGAIELCRQRQIFEGVSSSLTAP